MGIDYILKKAKELIQSGAIQSNISDSLIQAMEESPDGLGDLLTHIAQQAMDEHSGKDARRLYGNELIGYAIAYRVSKKQAEERENPKPKNVSLQESNKKIKGGLADELSIEDIANKFGVAVTKLQHELKMGIQIELEHTKNKKTAQDIAMDHLVEMPDYYTRLKKLEDNAIKHWSKKEIKESLHKKFLNS